MNCVRLTKILKLSGVNQVLSAFSACSELDLVGLDSVCVLVALHCFLRLASG